MSDSAPRLLIFGAHPDDPEFAAGGLATLYRQLGRPVKLISVTDGRSGHHEKFGDELVTIRRAESVASGAVIGAEYETWDFPDGSLEPTLEVRERIISEIRTWRPDLVLTHRTNDYHPDHRAVGQAVQDACYLVTVPGVVADIPALNQDPVVASLPDLFTRPCPLRPDIILDVEPFLDSIVSMLACQASQVFEWLPFNHGRESDLPEDPQARIAWLKDWYCERLALRRQRFDNALTTASDPAASSVRFIEVFEISEYASGLDAERRELLFPGRIKTSTSGCNDPRPG